MKLRYVSLVCVTVIAVLAIGCSKQEPTPESVAVPLGGATGTRGKLQGVNRLALGTLKLEGTEDAVTSEQAGELSPLWKIIQGGSLQGQAEMDAVLKQIEGKLTDSQRAAIDAMGLTFQDIGAWMQEQGVEMPTRPAGRQGGFGAFQNMSEEERQKFREEMQNMTQEQRATRLAEMGVQRPEGAGQGVPGGGPGGGQGGRPGFGGGGGGNFLVDPLIKLLTERAAQ